MSILREPFESDRSDNTDAVEPFLERRAIRPARRAVASGALACPVCELPLLPAGRLSLRELVACPFCGLEDCARSFLRVGARDTAANAVNVVARLPA